MDVTMELFESPLNMKEIKDNMSSSSLVTGAETGNNFSNVRVVEMDVHGNLLEKKSWAFFELNQ